MSYTDPKRHLVIPDSEEATLRRIEIETGGANTFRGYKHLTLTFNSTSWTDWEDDVWSFFLRAYTPLSSNLQSLTINIRGDKLFTADNYIKPAISYTVAVPATEISYENNDGENKVIPPKRGPGRPRKNAPKLVAPPLPISTPARLRTVTVPLDEIAPHISEKSIVGELLRLNTPIPTITITGPMQISLRRRLITSLNPHWRSSPHCVSQYGDMLSPHDAAALAVAETQEMEFENVRLVQRKEDRRQDADDWGIWRELKERERNGDWVVPTGKAGRNVVGWGAVGAWRGPSKVEVKKEEVEDDDDDDEVVKEEDDGEWAGPY